MFSIADIDASCPHRQNATGNNQPEVAAVEKNGGEILGNNNGDALHAAPQRSDSRESGILLRSSLVKEGSRHRVKKTVSFTSMPSEKKITSGEFIFSYLNNYMNERRNF